MRQLSTFAGSMHKKTKLPFDLPMERPFWSKGIVQRNVGKSIGVQADLVELPREQVQEIGSEDELEVPDWSCADEEKTPSDVPSPPNEPEASGGVTPEPAPTPALVPHPSGGVTPA